ncbi:hypothetical protein Syun_030738 [Stephania yunnanensis]|uniref:Uncharacterized protein n=1 Tax=Stephania yunnanensis TaxID=152371 RepID=A0AAP0HER2_9MAGN
MESPDEHSYHPEQCANHHFLHPTAKIAVVKIFALIEWYIRIQIIWRLKSKILYTHWNIGKQFHPRINTRKIKIIPNGIPIYSTILLLTLHERRYGGEGEVAALDGVDVGESGIWGVAMMACSLEDGPSEGYNDTLVDTNGYDDLNHEPRCALRCYKEKRIKPVTYNRKASHFLYRS